MNIKTKVKCLLCTTGDVVAEVGHPEMPTGGRLGGPKWIQPPYDRVTGYHCERCGNKYKFPPLKPEFDITPLIAEANAASRGT